MRDYLLFIDTETSGLPQDWHAPYSDRDSWPCSVQVAWAVYTQSGELVKQENHYIRDPDSPISAAAFRVHGISRDFLLREGKDRRDVMQQLAADLHQYQPLVVAHFMQLDYHMIGADFYRSGLENPLDKLPIFCTMLATGRYVSSPGARYLRLNRLHYILFRQEQEKQHDALADALATARCFFEMRRLGDLTDQQIARQQSILKIRKASGFRRGCIIPVLASVILTILIFLWL